MNTKRAGEYIKQPTGYRAFIPHPLPPDPPLKYDDELRNQPYIIKAKVSINGVDTSLTINDFKTKNTTYISSIFYPNNISSISSTLIHFSFAITNSLATCSIE